MKPFYYVGSGCFDILDKIEVLVPDDRFYQPGGDAYSAAVLAMMPDDRSRWARYMQTVEQIMIFNGSLGVD